MTASSRPPVRYPLATLAPYGPDNTFATKLVVSVVPKANREATVMRTWTSDATDVRNDHAIAEQVQRFLEQHGVKHTIVADRIMGCPHEEGIDYPMGRTCPRCPFWADIDRFTHERILPPPPTMSPEEVLAALSVESPAIPREALASADGHREALVDPLLRALERGIASQRTASPDEATLFSYALYLFAKWRETRAYPLVIDWLSLPGEGAFDLAGDVPTKDGQRILASVCDGNLEPIRALILNRQAEEYCRGTAVTALALLAAWAEMPREPIIESLSWLAREGLEREPSMVWGSLVAAAVDIEALETFSDLRRAYDEGFVDPGYIERSEMDDAEAEPPGQLLERTRETYVPIADVAEEIGWWRQFANARQMRGPEPHKASPKIGRNERCPCGSGKKYKKCCGA